MCMCRPVIDKIPLLGPLDALFQLLVPNAVLRLGATGVHFLAMTVTEPRIDPQRDRSARRPLAVLVDHVGRSAVDVDVVLQHVAQRFTIEDIGGVDDLRGMRLLARLESGRNRAVHFAGADTVD